MSYFPAVRSDLATRYGLERLPRYTSYPTAPHFSCNIDEHAYRDWLWSLPPQSEASVYLHVPFCRAMCWYCGCNTTVVKRDEPIAAYAVTLGREIDQVTSEIGRRIPVDHIHFGGGTPTILSPANFGDLVERLRDRFLVRPAAEVAVEIDPRTLTPPMIAALAIGGVNRASFGVQSFDPLVQQAIHRIQSFKETAAAASGLRRAGVRGINFDLIYGLPHQTVASCLDTVRQCLELLPDRFSVFGYAHVPAFKKHQRKIDGASLPDSLERHRQSESIAHALADAGYRRIGLDHFALAGDKMAVAQADGSLRRNFQGYTTDTSNLLLGFGASAIGRLAQGYIQNEAGIRAYSERIAKGGLATVKGYALTHEDRLRAEIIERIMCDFRVDLEPICAGYGSTAQELLDRAPRLHSLASDGVIKLSGSSISVTDDFRYLVRSVAAAFDAHLNPSGNIHSRAV